ncbi:hypothetical protein EMPS_02548 [Entomortierella parvispora]|uniref:Protein disulfide-isomerase n=1 Tax=Entomortierella parvispora TaxID=205924 RepID=A0A9P3H4X5_9FUNG|nr:hypothetical protein EMPS_02548 [Entomortierella parvispora]
MRVSTAIALVTLASATFVRASNVIELTKETFKGVVSPDQEIILVDFYTPWCGHCKNLEPEFEKAAEELKKSDIPLAKVDCTEQSELCKDYEVTGYPTLKIFKKGIPRDYKGTRKSEGTDGIISYVKKHAAPPVTELTPETLPAFAASERVVVVAVLPKNSIMHEDVERIANYYRDDFIFGEVETHPDVKAPGIVLYKKFDEGKNIYEGKFNDRSLVKFVRANCLPLLDEMGPKNYAHYMDGGLPLAYLFFGNQEQLDTYKDDLIKYAKEMKGTVNFVTVDGTRFGAHAANVGLEEVWPGFALQDVNTADKYPLILAEGETLTIERMREHTKKTLAGELRSKLKSEAIPASNDGPVTIVVAHNYADIVEQQEKDVLIEYYAPWCGFCKQLEPIYEELGELYKGSNIVIAKFDATANDLPSNVPFRVDGYPTIKFKKAGSKEYMEYSGGRTKEDFVDFLNTHAVNKYDVGIQKVVKSEAIPASNDGPVTIVVANNYADIVEQQEKDVLIEYYAPWCGFCKQLEPIYEELGELYKGSDIVIAKFDATANELPKSVPFQVQGYPTIKFKKAGSKEYMEYSGGRTKEDFVDFLNTHAVNKFDVGIQKVVKSEAIPTSNDGPVTIVVANNYADIVDQKDKDILIEYYAPWCGFCKMLAPIYDEVGELYKGTNIVVAKFDVTANELPKSVPFEVDGYPTIKFKKAGTDTYIDYNGERTKEGFVSFLTKHATIKVEVNNTENPVAQDIEHDEL